MWTSLSQFCNTWMTTSSAQPWPASARHGKLVSGNHGIGCHICFDSENALVARLAWLERQLNHPLQLKSLELHSGMPSPTLEVEVANLASVCIAWNPDIISAFRLWGMQAIVWRPHP